MIWQNEPVAVDRITNREELETFFRLDPGLRFYELGDLDDFFWPHTTWYGLRENGALKEVLLLYRGGPMPVLLALSRQVEGMSLLVRESLPDLPQRLYLHLSPGLDALFMAEFNLISHGSFLKMRLTERDLAGDVEQAEAVVLSRSDLEELLALYQRSYPGNWFDPRMIDTGCYFGLRLDRKLVCVAGIHVHSRTYRIAALGNITTHPDYRGRGSRSGR